MEGKNDDLKLSTDAATADTSVKRGAAWIKPLEEMTASDVLNRAIAIERLRRKLPVAWMEFIACGLIGAAIGVFLQQGKVEGTWPLVSLFSGIALLVGWVFLHEDRTENLNNLCDDYLRFIDEWAELAPGHKNSEYVLGVVNETHGNTPLTRIYARIRSGKSHRGQDA